MLNITIHSVHMNTLCPYPMSMNYWLYISNWKYGYEMLCDSAKLIWNAISHSKHR